MHVCAPRVCSALRGQKRALEPLEGWMELACGCWALKRVLEEQPGLLTSEPSLKFKTKVLGSGSPKRWPDWRVQKC